LESIESDASGLPTGLAEHLLRPRGAGVPPAGSGAVSGEGHNAACGDRLVLWIWPQSGGYGIGFQAQACSAVLAVASLGCEALGSSLGAAADRGALRAAAADLDLAGRVAQLGGLPRQKAHAIAVFERALAAALARLGDG
jgi:NifU-like protein involved in Fe-S cluster formation